MSNISVVNTMHAVASITLNMCGLHYLFINMHLPVMLKASSNMIVNCKPDLLATYKQFWITNKY